MPLTIYACPDMGLTPADTAQVPDGGGWAKIELAGEPADARRQILQSRALQRSISRSYGIRPITALLPQTATLTVKVNLTSFADPDARRRQRVRGHVRDLVATDARRGYGRTFRAHVRIAMAQRERGGQDEITDAHTTIAYFSTFKQLIAEHIDFNPDRQYPGTYLSPLFVFALALAATAPVSNPAARAWMYSIAGLTFMAALAYAALFVGWKYGYGQAIWHCAEANTYDSKVRTRDRDEVDRQRKIAEKARRAAQRAAQLESERQAKARRLGFRLPQPPAWEGYVYVVGFSTGSVKVGMSEDPQVRLETHRAKASAFGVHVTNYWVSPSHVNFKDNETRLINQCLKVSTRSRKEYFHEVGYDRAVQFANALTYFSDNTEQTSVSGVWA